MAAITYSKVDPYPQEEGIYKGVMFKPDDYKLSLMVMRLSPISLRVLTYAMASMQADGSVELSAIKMSRMFQINSSFISKGIQELIRYNFLARRSRSVFWLNPSVARPLTIQVT